MKSKFTKNSSKTIFTQNYDGTYEIENWSYLTCRKDWWRSGIRHNCPQSEAEEMMNRLERKGFIVA